MFHGPIIFHGVCVAGGTGVGGGGVGGGVGDGVGGGGGVGGFTKHDAGPLPQVRLSVMGSRSCRFWSVLWNSKVMRCTPSAGTLLTSELADASTIGE